MSTTYFLSPLSANILAKFGSLDDLPNLGYEINLNSFAQGLQQIWSDVSLEIETNGVEWQLEDEDGVISGAIQLPYIVTLSLGSNRRTIEFLNWYRGFFPSKDTLYMFHLGHPKGVALDANHRITEKDLENL